MGKFRLNTLYRVETKLRPQHGFNEAGDRILENHSWGNDSIVICLDMTKPKNLNLYWHIKFFDVKMNQIFWLRERSLNTSIVNYLGLSSEFIEI